MILAVVFVLSLAYELWRALPQGPDTRFFGLPATASVSRLLPVLGSSDAGSYLGAARDLQDGSISSKYLWVLNLWPPGMPYLLATMIKAGGGASPIIPMVILICVLWSVVLTVLAAICMSHRGYLSLVVFAVIWLASPVFTSWTIHQGVLGSDGLATAIGSLTAIGLMYVAFSKPGGRVRWALYIALGFGFAALAYLRIMWFYAVPAALLVLAVLALVRIVYLLVRKKRETVRHERRSYFEWVILGVTFIALCAPWTVYGEATLHPGSYSWSQGDYQFGQLWMSDHYLQSTGAGFLDSGGANWPCHIDEVECKVIAQQEFSTTAPYGGLAPNTFTHLEHAAFKVALTHPGEFIANRSVFTIRTWLSAPGGGVGTFDNAGFGVVTLLAFLGALCILLWRSRRSASALCLFLILGANMGVLWLTHFETRYVVPLQAMSMVIVVFAALPLEARLWTKVARSMRQGEDRTDRATTRKTEQE